MTVELNTEAELIIQIQEVDAAISTAMGMSEYDIETGQSKQRIKRQKLSELTKYRALLVARLSALRGDGTLHYINKRF